MQISFANELGALERAITRLDEAIVRRQDEAGNNFEKIVLYDLRNSHTVLFSLRVLAIRPGGPRRG